MGMVTGKGSFVNSRFVLTGNKKFTSTNPSCSRECLFETTSGENLVDDAVEAAKKALPVWAKKSQAERNNALLKLKEVFTQRQEEIAKVISLEMGKIYSESLAEARNLAARIELTISQGLRRVSTEKPPGIQGETRYHAQGVLTVLGPYNFPAHLVNAHVIPALLTGNTVVTKFSEFCPWVGEIYADCVKAAELPMGVFNMLQGGKEVGQKLVTHNFVDGILFTGSYETGRQLKSLTLDEPHKILALEMGGKNTAVVLKDAHPFQAVSEIIQGAFLTTGQRCTATSRVLIEKPIFDQITNSLVNITKNLKPSDPFEASAVFGPLANKAAKDRFLKLVEQAGINGCEAFVPTKSLDESFVTPSLHFSKQKHVPGYLDTELFGPDICLQVVDNLEEAIWHVNQSNYGLSNAIFTKEESNFEEFYNKTRAGVVNWNRSTNGAYGAQPFGGVNKSGNQRAAGIDAVRYTTFPVAVNKLAFGETSPVLPLHNILHNEEQNLKLPYQTLTTRHKVEQLLENFSIPIDNAFLNQIVVPLKTFENLKFNGQKLQTDQLLENLKPFVSLDDSHLRLVVPEDTKQHEFLEKTHAFFDKLHDTNYFKFRSHFSTAINIPKEQTLPRSKQLLERLYAGKFVPLEKKTPVIDLNRSKDGFLVSVDDDPLVLFDAASQIASLGTGFQADCYLNALEENKLTTLLTSNLKNKKEPCDWEAEYKKLLLENCWDKIQHLTFTPSGAIANEKAFDLCRQNGPGGTKVLAFEGSFHGRSLMSLQTTFNPQKRAPFEFKGYEASFAPFPTWTNPKTEPSVTAEWIQNWSQGKIYSAPKDDKLLNAEVESLKAVKLVLEKEKMCAVIVEPMQCEGGDKYATARFFNGLRALTRYFKVPLIFDEVQTGFNLLGPFFAHQAFSLKDAEGNVDGPDCITLAKKAQLGVCLSAWPDPRPDEPHHVQVARGFLQAKLLSKNKAFATKLETQIEAKLLQLKKVFPKLVINPRNKAYAMAFDLPSNHLAMQLINQRFYRGFMAYIAGNNTVRFRLNLKSDTSTLDVFFEQLTASLTYIEQNIKSEKDSVPNWLSGMNTANKRRQIQELPSGLQFQVCAASEWEYFEPQIKALEQKTYEKSRRDSMHFLKNLLQEKDSLGLLVLDDKKSIKGYAFGGPLEYSEADGPLQDCMRSKNNTFYSANLLVENSVRGKGIGYLLKKEQLEMVRAIKKEDGTSRYHYVTGRNKVGLTSEISRINKSFGAQALEVYDNQYGTEKAKALYYRIPLRAPLLLNLSNEQKDKLLDWATGLEAPLRRSGSRILEEVQHGNFTSAVGTKLTLSNWITPNFVRYTELLRQLAPSSCKHAYFSSGRDETVDKGLRCLRAIRPNAEIAIGLEHQFLGETSSAARSLSTNLDRKEPFAWFDWPLVAHPTKNNPVASIEQIQRHIENFGADKILGVVIELIGEKTGFMVDQSFLNELGEIREQTGVPLIFVETTSALGRNGKTLFLSESLNVKPNMIWWFTGGQLGHVLVDDKHFVSKPLTLISTWDSDEISILRNYQYLVAAKKSLENNTASLLTSAMSKINSPYTAHGTGLWHVFHFDTSKLADTFLKESLKAGVSLKPVSKNCIALCPPLDVSEKEISLGIKAIEHAISKTATA